MPDLDQIERGLPMYWRAPYKLIKGKHDVPVVARSVVKALAAWLRETEGASALPELSALLQRRDAGELDERTLAKKAAKLDRHFLSRNNKLAVAALRHPEVSGPTASLAGPPDVRLAKSMLYRVLDHVLLSKQRNYLVGRRYQNRAEAIEFENNLLKLIERPIARMAKQLATNPLAKGFRAPPFPAGARRTTAVLLNEPI